MSIYYFDKVVKRFVRLMMPGRSWSVSTLSGFLKINRLARARGYVYILCIMSVMLYYLLIIYIQVISC